MMLMEYALAVGRHEHEVLQEITPSAFARYIAYRNVQEKQRQRAEKRARAKARNR